MATRERRSLSRMVVILLEEGLDARDASPVVDRVIEVVPRSAGARRTMMWLEDSLRARLAAVAEAEDRTLDAATAVLVHEAFEARKRAAARKTA